MQNDRENLDNKTLMSEKRNPSSSMHPENINKRKQGEYKSIYINDNIYVYIIKK